MNKYEELYNLSKEVLNQENNRYRSLDQKASRYLTALTFIVGIYGFFVSRLLPQLLLPNSFIDWLLVIILILLFFFIILSWFFLFAILRTSSLATTPLNIKFFVDHKLVDIYYSLTKTNEIALLKNSKRNNRKSKFLKWAYIFMKIAMFFIILLFFCFAFYACSMSN